MHLSKRSLALVVTLGTLASGCAPRLAASSWRLANNVLTPPGVSGPSVTNGTVKTPAGVKGICPQDVRLRRGGVVVKVSRSRLNSHPPGWLSTWTDDLEAQGCIAQGAAFRLARDIVESLPLEMNTPLHLLYPDDPDIVEIDPSVLLQIMTPIVADGADPDAPLVEVTNATGNGTTLNLDARFTPNVLGYEITSYSVRPRGEQSGVFVAPVSTERHMKGQTEQVALPIRNYFEPLKDASFYALFYKGGQTEFTALIIGGITRAHLDRRIKLLETGTASCEALNGAMCVTVPKRSAINPMITVTVNGAETLLQWGARVGMAIDARGRFRSIDVLPQLQVFRPYRGRLARVEFDPSDSAILDLILMGGETISWR